MAQNRILIGQYMHFFMGGKIAEIRAVVLFRRWTVPHILNRRIRSKQLRLNFHYSLLKS